MSDLRYAFRQFLKQPGFKAVAVLRLASISRSFCFTLSVLAAAFAAGAQSR